MNITSGTITKLPTGLAEGISHYRHRVFVDTLGWTLQTCNGMELDQFDRSDTLYVVAQDEQHCINGCARLMPTDRPYLLGEIFPQLMNGEPPPCSPDVWELSRFAAVDFKGRGASGNGQFSSPTAVELLRESIHCAARHGARRLITVSPVGVERLLRRAGFHAHRAGPPMIVDEHPIFACWIEVST
ncbi:MAG TPA: acyl-homoserine-lactone synthase [Gammaproteobacteria bacterium]|nr:acyl-homoserine-lactone synthase [Gammaproteobacteria bacterium]